MEIVLVAVAPEAGYAEYELLRRHLRGPGWEAEVLPVDEAIEQPPAAAAVVAVATDWPAEQVGPWLAALRQAVGPRKRLLALMPQPPESYPPETQALWTRALGYGTRLREAAEIVGDFVAGRT